MENNMENNKELYFTPNVEDLCIEYICEYSKNYDDLDDNNKNTSFEQVTISKESIGAYCRFGGYGSLIDTLQYAVLNPQYGSIVRTKYLDKQDIESLNYEQRGDEKYFYSLDLNLSLIYDFEIKELYVHNRDSEIEKNLRFKGKCNSINELKIILKWIM